MNWHIRKKHNKKLTRYCMICGSACSNCSALNCHMINNHRNHKIFCCMICGSACSSNSETNWHIRKKHKKENILLHDMWKCLQQQLRNELAHKNKLQWYCMICGNARQGSNYHSINILVLYISTA